MFRAVPGARERPRFPRRPLSERSRAGRASRWLLPQALQPTALLIPTVSTQSARACDLAEPVERLQYIGEHLHLPTASLESAVTVNEVRDRVIEPSLSFSFTSARSRRTLAALASAAWRCSGVSAGGCYGMAVETV